ncbi:MAG: SMP-30/gluconolactonase/LRE family protein [Gemmatimonadetes bacterium]|nr:SMP-30/gluconolactonase/LRE family protein [Gemmatimonadota bacterium]
MKTICVKRRILRPQGRALTHVLVAVSVWGVGCGAGAEQEANFGEPDYSEQSADATLHVAGTMELSNELISLGGEGGVAVDESGTIYVSNFHSSVWSVTPAGVVTLVSDDFQTASGNTVLPGGVLMQSDFRGNRVVTIDAGGELHDFSTEGLHGPVGVVRAPSGIVYVANCLGKYIASIAQGGGPARVFVEDDRFGCPNGITSDAEGNLYVADLENPIVFKITPDGSMTEHADLGGPGNGHLAFVGDALYVTQLRAHQIVRLDADGSHRVVTGTGDRGFVNGPEGTATVSFPNGIAADPSGTVLYFNTHMGVMQGGNRGSMIMRRLLVPTG